MKNTAVTEFILALATVALTGIIFIGCGGDPACENGGCGPDPDGGTSGDGNPINKDDGGTDAGDVTTGDAGSDAGKADCSPLRAKLQKEWTLFEKQENNCSDSEYIGQTIMGKVEDADYTCRTTFKGAGPNGDDGYDTWAFYGTKLPLKETSEKNDFTLTVELVGDNILQITLSAPSYGYTCILKYE